MMDDDVEDVDNDIVGGGDMGEVYDKLKIPICDDIVLRRPSGTNFRFVPEHSFRLTELRFVKFGFRKHRIRILAECEFAFRA